MTTLVTGAGLIGTAFAQNALKRNEDVVFFDPEPRADFIAKKLGTKDVAQVRGDVRDLPKLIETIKEYKCETVVHTAGIIGGKVDQLMYSALQINIQGTMNVAEASRLMDVRRLVHVSTFGVYDMRRDDTPKVMSEDWHRGHGRSYGNSKVAKELILEAYHNRYDLELVGVRPANVFGNGHFWSGSGGGAKIHELMVAGHEGRVAKIPEGQTMANEYIYSKDIGAIMDAAATVPQPKEMLFFNGGTGINTPFDDLIGAVQKIHPGLEYEVIPGKGGKNRDTILDMGAAKKHLGFEPGYSLDAALADYAQEISEIGAF
ncbi:MAG: NAD(P)-dependent oxidoreductase [Rhodospirillales bacterium]|jgi:nucleoside-diphosphate-sugar epimerase|nr:NAD(P)-dependent oxidoreductase [Rhodospirillales bacterium]MBT4006449.1 NAD(P)-dependent oxidoreductase [Rhodospirillales bacterium]MBT5076487.1 NAD(P)-dependent oxidoreductase [Rhodospirillales bacterium]MBT5112619.1 NAD(P)-dependent oxidoreductase [Rhodospirillales bacterium]MBT5673388.1 NAD(P)-dependent oxidoreductase [Rhodospirillales bacterium]